MRVSRPSDGQLLPASTSKRTNANVIIYNMRKHFSNVIIIQDDAKKAQHMVTHQNRAIEQFITGPITA